MKIFNFFKKKENAIPNEAAIKPEPDKSRWLGKDFEFLIRGDIELTAENYDDIMTPNTMAWQKVIQDGYAYYKVGNDEICYSWEMPGIQMTFNPEITYLKAKQIADEVMQNLINAGQFPELVTLQSDILYRLD
ncbi:hypothetical protein AAEO56_01120 [Flavobacterium sp. DGU11]|uniref:Uncharacterized protein n=1 Tax=Flavobacterium arundinis TaxID=3139143 RepID=A0ABU9HS89_9FLAO